MIPQQTYDEKRFDLRRVILVPYSGEQAEAMKENARATALAIKAETTHARPEEFTFLVTPTNNANRYADAISSILPKTIFTERDIRQTPYLLRAEDLSDLCKGAETSSERIFSDYDQPDQQTKQIELAYYNGQTNLIVIARPYVLEQIGLAILQQFGKPRRENETMKRVYSQPVSLVIDPTKRLQSETQSDTDF